MKLFFVFMNSICRDESRYTRHARAISGYLISIDFQRLTGCRRDPRVLGSHRQPQFGSLLDMGSCLSWFKVVVSVIDSDGL